MIKKVVTGTNNSAETDIPMSIKLFPRGTVSLSSVCYCSCGSAFDGDGICAQGHVSHFRSNEWAFAGLFKNQKKLKN